MEALVVLCDINEGLLIHMSSQRVIYRLFVPEADDLVITPYRAAVHVWSGKGIPNYTRIAAEVEVSPDLVQAARDIVDAQASLKVMLVHEPLGHHFARQMSS